MYQYSTVEKNIFQKNIKTYVIIDLAINEDIWIYITQIFKLKYYSLANDEDHKDLEFVAPYIVELTEKSDFLYWLLKEGYGNYWMIFLQTDKRIEKLKEQFSDFFYQKIEVKINNNIEYQESYFAFYDPRVLMGYMNVLNETDKIDFFDGIDCFLCENIFNEKELLKYKLDTNNKVAVNKLEIKGNV